MAFDECIPHRLLLAMPPEWTSAVAQKIGYAGFQDGSLLDALESEFDVLVTFDKGIPFQNNLRGRRLGILRLDLKRSSYPTLEQYHDRIISAIEEAEGRTLILTRQGLDEIARPPLED